MIAKAMRSLRNAQFLVNGHTVELLRVPVTDVRRSLSRKPLSPRRRSRTPVEVTSTTCVHWLPSATGRTSDMQAKRPQPSAPPSRGGTGQPFGWFVAWSGARLPIAGAGDRESGNLSMWAGLLTALGRCGAIKTRVRMLRNAAELGFDNRGKSPRISRALSQPSSGFLHQLMPALLIR